MCTKFNSRICLNIDGAVLTDQYRISITAIGLWFMSCCSLKSLNWNDCGRREMTGLTNGYFDGSDDRYEEIEIPVPWGHISGKWWGSKHRQPILAIHGWQDNAATFDILAPLLVNNDLSVLCIDLPGHGRSSHYPMGSFYYIFWDGVHLVRRIIKHYGWEDVILLGHSLGGAISFLYAAIFPLDIKKYISIDIAGPPIRDELMYSKLATSVDKFLSYENISEEKIPTYSYEEMLDLVEKAYNQSLSRKSCEILMRRGMTKSKQGGYHFSRDLRVKVSALGFICLQQVMDLAGRIKCEVMNIRGNPGMTLEKPENYTMVLDEIEKNAKRLVRHVVHGHHHLHMDNADSIAGFIADFIES